ncbi:hypothetical protein EI555_008448, partial [Monodon monoceros]
ERLVPFEAQRNCDPGPCGEASGTLAIIVLSNHTVGRYQCVAWMPAGAVGSHRASHCDTSQGLSLGE